jgi:uncharacterized membrane protein YuzA (DUF378 family)
MMGRKMCGLHKLALILVIVGALNWGLIGVVQFNLVEYLFKDSWLTSLIYILVGVAGLAMLTAGHCCLGKGMGHGPEGACQSGKGENCCCPPGAPKKETPPVAGQDQK